MWGDLVSPHLSKKKQIMTKFTDLRQNKTPLSGKTKFYTLVVENGTTCSTDIPIHSWKNIDLLWIDQNGVAIFSAHDNVGGLTYIGYAGAEFNL